MHPLGAAQEDRHPAFGGEGIRHLDDEPPADAFAPQSFHGLAAGHVCLTICQRVGSHSTDDGAPFVGDDGGVTNVLSNDALFKIQSDVIRAVAARESAVFVGRCADYILRENPRCVNVFLTADDADRIGRIRRRQGCTAEEARAMMERVDARRASYYNYYSSRTWGEAATYHLCVSTSPLGDEGTADFILEFAARKLNMKF